MTGTQHAESTRRAYRYKVWLRVISGLFGSFFAVGGVAVLLDAAIPHTVHHPMPAVFAVLPLSLATYLLAATFRPRITIDSARIDVRGAFSNRSASLNEIEGIRARPSRYGSYKQLVLKDGSSPITLRTGFKVDDDYRAWMQQLPDLDRRDRDALLAEIQQREDLGATPEERLGALARARRQNIALVVLVAAVAAGLDFGSAPWVQPCGWPWRWRRL